jgi:PT repeat
MKLRVGGAVLIAVTALALAGCGGSGDGGPATSSDAQTQYRDCLSRNGVTLPSSRPSGFPTVRPTDRPTVRPTARPSRSSSGFGNGRFGNGFPQGVDASAFAKAQQACASLRPSGQPGFGGNRGADSRNAAYRNCLSEHGVTLQDGQPPASSDPKVAAALQTCAVLKPSPRPTN